MIKIYIIPNKLVIGQDSVLFIWSGKFNSQFKKNNSKYLNNSEFKGFVCILY